MNVNAETNLETHRISIHSYLIQTVCAKVLPYHFYIIVCRVYYAWWDCLAHHRLLTAYDNIWIVRDVQPFLYSVNSAVCRNEFKWNRHDAHDTQTTRSTPPVLACRHIYTLSVRFIVSVDEMKEKWCNAQHPSTVDTCFIRLFQVTTDTNSFQHLSRMRFLSWDRNE